MSNNRVLIVFPDSPYVTELATTFEKCGFGVSTVSSAKEATAMARRFLPALVVVDLDLLVADGFDFCWKIRNSSLTRNARILMLSEGRGGELELVGLLRGADDYLVKPLQLEQVTYRAGILLKQKSMHEQSRHPIRRDGFELDFDRRIAAVDGFDLELTITEFRLLWALAQKPGFVFSRLDLVNLCRGNDANCEERTIDVHIGSIRRKLGRFSNLVQTVRGVGYRFRETAVRTAAFERENDDNFDVYIESKAPFAPNSDSTPRQLNAMRDREESKSLVANSVLQIDDPWNS